MHSLDMGSLKLASFWEKVFK